MHTLHFSRVNRYGESMFYPSSNHTLEAMTNDTSNRFKFRTVNVMKYLLPGWSKIFEPPGGGIEILVDLIIFKNTKQVDWSK